MLNKWKQALKGELPLWKVFWIGHVLGYFIMSVVTGLLGAALDTDIFFKPVLVIFIALSSYAIFKCSKNVQRKVWGTLAKIYAVLWALAFLLGAITIPVALYL